MKNIFMCGTEQSLINTMHERGYRITNMEVSENKEEQTWTFLLKDIHYNYETKVTFQVNECDEDNIIVALNVVKISCELIGK